MCFRSQQPEKLFTSKENLDYDLSGDPNSSPEAHLPSICLKQVFPKYAKQFNYLRLVDRMANLFIRFLGIKGTMKLGPTGFRTFIRLVRPASSSLSLIRMATWPLTPLGDHSNESVPCLRLYSPRGWHRSCRIVNSCQMS